MEYKEEPWEWLDDEEMDGGDEMLATTGRNEPIMGSVTMPASVATKELAVIETETAAKEDAKAPARGWQDRAAQEGVAHGTIPKTRKVYRPPPYIIVPRP